MRIEQLVDGANTMITPKCLVGTTVFIDMKILKFSQKFFLPLFLKIHR